MSIYTYKDYRKIYESYHGPIPYDETGRRYEIHHIDGNHNNNNISNLKLVTIQEHYEIHKAQGDWAACLIMSERMKISPEEKTILARAVQKRKVNAGTHHFLGGEISRKTQAKRVAEGTHNLLGGEVQGKTSRRRVADGTHNLLGPEQNLKRIADGTHNLLKRADGSSQSSDRVKDGTHPWLNGKATQKQLKDGTHASKIKVGCLGCQQILDKANYSRYHGVKCRLAY
jgi:hypothetical protein